MVALAGLDALARQMRRKPPFALEMVNGGGCWCDTGHVSAAQSGSGGIRSDTGTLSFLDLEDGILVPSEACVARTMCWQVQLALTCCPGEARSLPAGHPLKWL